MKILFNAARLQITHTRTHALMCARTYAHAHTTTHTTQLSAEGPDEPELKLHVLQFVHNVAGFIDLVPDLQGFHNKTTKKGGLSHDRQGQPGLVESTWFRQGNVLEHDSMQFTSFEAHWEAF